MIAYCGYQTWVGSLFATQKASTWRASKYLLAD